MGQFETGSASKAYARVAQVVMDPRDLEASSVLEAEALGKSYSDIAAGLGSKNGTRQPQRAA
jgi:hypothetical protein